MNVRTDLEQAVKFFGDIYKQALVVDQVIADLGRAQEPVEPLPTRCDVLKYVGREGALGAFVHQDGRFAETTKHLTPSAATWMDFVHLSVAYWGAELYHAALCKGGHDVPHFPRINRAIENFIDIVKADRQLPDPPIRDGSVDAGSTDGEERFAAESIQGTMVAQALGLILARTYGSKHLADMPKKSLHEAVGFLRDAAENYLRAN